MSITFFFIGKCFITVSFTGLYVYTSELWPTNIRHSMMGFCSTVGRIGAALAPMAPLLVYISHRLRIYFWTRSINKISYEFTESIFGDLTIFNIWHDVNDSSHIDIETAGDIEKKTSRYNVRSWKNRTHWISRWNILNNQQFLPCFSYTLLNTFCYYIIVCCHKIRKLFENMSNWSQTKRISITILFTIDVLSVFRGTYTNWNWISIMNFGLLQYYFVIIPTINVNKL